MASYFVEVARLCSIKDWSHIKVPSAYKTRQIESVCCTWLGMWVQCEEEDRRWLLTLQKLCDCAASKFLVHSRPDRQRVCVSHDEECESHMRRKKDRHLLTLRKSRDCAASKIGQTPAKSCGKDWMRNLGLGFSTSELQQQARLQAKKTRGVHVGSSTYLGREVWAPQSTEKEMQESFSNSRIGMPEKASTGTHSWPKHRCIKP